MKKHILIFAAAIVMAEVAAAQTTPCAPNASRCLASLRSGICGSWTAAGNGIVDPATPACADVPGPAFDGQYWVKWTPAAGTENISVKVDITALGGGTAPLLDAAFQLYSQPAASDNCTTGPYTLVGCYNNAGAGVDEVVSISGISNANVYYLRIFEVGRIMDCAGGGQHKDFILCVSETGENACGAKVISSLPFDSGVLNNTGYGNNNTGGCPGKLTAIDATGEDYWFVYNSPGDEYVTMRLEGKDAGDKVSVKVIEKGAVSCDAASTIPCYDEFNGSVVNGTFGGALDAGAAQTDAVPRSIYLETAGSYYFIFDTDAGAASNFRFKLSPFTPSGKDICSGARDIGGAGPYNIVINDYLYTGDAIDPPSNEPGAITYNPLRNFANRNTENTKWLKFTVSTTGTPITLTFSGLTCDSADNCLADLQFIVFRNASYDASCTGFSAATIQMGDCGCCEISPPGEPPCTPVPAGDAIAGRIFFVQIDGNCGAHCTMDVTTTNTVPSASNTITTSAIAPATYCAGSAVSVPYTITGSYNPANVFTAQLSNSAGSFAAPTGIGTLASQIAGTISATIPPGTSSGSGYRIRVISDDPAVTGSDNGANITINALPTITLGANPSVCSGTTSANLTYSATTGSPDQYSIDYDATAVAQGFVDVTNAALPASPIVLTVPGGAATGTYNYTVTVRNSTTGCVSGSTAKTISVNVVPTIGF